MTNKIISMRPIMYKAILLLVLLNLLLALIKQILAHQTAITWTSGLGAGDHCFAAMVIFVIAIFLRPSNLELTAHSAERQ